MQRGLAKQSPQGTGPAGVKDADHDGERARLDGDVAVVVHESGGDSDRAQLKGGKRGWKPLAPSPTGLGIGQTENKVECCEGARARASSTTVG